MGKKLFISTLSFVFLFLTFHAHADAPAWNIDKAHSSIHFGIQHIYSTVKGHFNEFDGEIRFDPGDLSRSRIHFTVNVKSIDTRVAKRDNHLLSGDFFDAGKYPVMTFKSSLIKHLGENRYMVDGVLSIKDVNRNISVPFTYFGSKPHPANPKQLVTGFEAQVTIDRLEYHIGDGKFLKMGVVGKDATVQISIEATRNS